MIVVFNLKFKGEIIMDNIDISKLEYKDVINVVYNALLKS